MSECDHGSVSDVRAPAGYTQRTMEEVIAEAATKKGWYLTEGFIEIEISGHKCSPAQCGLFGLPVGLNPYPESLGVSLEQLRIIDAASCVYPLTTDAQRSTRAQMFMAFELGPYSYSIAALGVPCHVGLGSICCGIFNVLTDGVQCCNECGETLDKVIHERVCSKAIEAVGWMFAEACKAAGTSEDLRHINQAALVDRAMKELGLR